MPIERANAAIVARRCLFGAAGLLLATGARAQSVSFTPNTAAAVVQTVTTSSAAYQLPGIGTGAADIFWNTGANTLYLAFGQSGSVTATTSSTPVCGGCWIELAPGQNGWVAVVTGSGTTGVTIVGGQGLATGAGPGGSGGGGGGAVTIADGADVTLGAKADAKSTATDTTPITIMSVMKQISASVQALVSGITGTVTANLGTLNGAATAANQSTANASLATIATNVGSDPCQTLAKTSLPFSQTASARLILATSAKKTYFCSILIVAADAENLSLVEGTGSVCATGIAAVIGATTAANGMNLAANGGFALGSGGATIASGATNNTDTCLFQSGSGRVSGVLTYVQQ